MCPMFVGGICGLSKKRDRVWSTSEFLARQSAIVRKVKDRLYGINTLQGFLKRSLA